MSPPKLRGPNVLVSELGCFHSLGSDSVPGAAEVAMVSSPSQLGRGSAAGEVGDS